MSKQPSRLMRRAPTGEAPGIAIDAASEQDRLAHGALVSPRRAIPRGTAFAVLWIDLDHFKDINDIHGHVVGDQILRIVSDKLRFEMPADTLIARLGGDEFIVLCQVNDALEARMIGQQLRRLLNRPIEVGEKSLVSGASMLLF